MSKKTDPKKKSPCQKRIPFKKGGCERDRAIQSAGGKACAEKKRLMKTMREWAVIFRDTPMKDDPRLTMGGGVALRMYHAALEGDVRAAEFLSRLQGEMVEKVQNVEPPKLVDDI
ncbi:MAG: hypothetical protein ACI4Q3_00535 [Kiritimatiellia bacterium]